MKIITPLAVVILSENESEVDQYPQIMFFFLPSTVAPMISNPMWVERGSSTSKTSDGVFQKAKVEGRTG